MSDTPAAVPLEGATPEEQAQNLYAVLKPQAISAAREFVLRQTPADLQDAMMATIEADLPVPEVAAMKLPWNTPKGIIGQLAAQKALRELAESKMDEIEVEDPPAPTQTPAPAPAPAV